MICDSWPLRADVVGEAVHRSAVDDQLEVGSRGVHLFDEARQLCGGEVRVQSTVTDEQLGLDPSWTGGVCGLEGSVDADRAGQVRPGSRELEDRSAAEAVTHGRDVPVKQWMRGEHLNASLRSSSNLVAVSYELLDARHYALTVARHGLAIHVAGEHEESEFGELSRATFGVIVQPGAAVNDEDSRMSEFTAVSDKDAG